MSADNTTFTVIAEWSDPDMNDGNWPYPNRYTTSLIEGTLADRIRAKFDCPASVLITETVISGGWSEYTQENSYEFTVKCGSNEHEFSQWSGYDNGLKGLLDWLDG